MTLKRKNPGSFAEKMAQSVIPIGQRCTAFFPGKIEVASFAQM
jgi:hypothetical protein